MTSKLRAKKFRIPRPDVLEAVDASLGVTDGNPELGSALAHAHQIPAPNTPAPRIAAPQVPSLDEEVARPLEAPTGSPSLRISSIFVRPVGASRGRATSSSKLGTRVAAIRVAGGLGWGL